MYSGNFGNIFFVVGAILKNIFFEEVALKNFLKKFFKRPILREQF